MRKNKCAILYLLFVFCFLLPVRAQEKSTNSETHVSSSSSEQKSSTLNLGSMTLEDLQTQARSELAKLRDDLIYWKQSSMNASAALKQSIERVMILEATNEQIATRMQQRDEDLAAAYNKIKQLEQSVKGQLIIITALGLMLLVIFLIRLWRMVR